MASYMDYHYERTAGEHLFGHSEHSADTRGQAYPYRRQDTDNTLVDEYYDMPVSLHSDQDSFSSSFQHDSPNYLTPASSLDHLSHGQQTSKDNSPSMSEMHRYLRGNYNHVTPQSGSHGTPLREGYGVASLNTTLPPATMQEEDEMMITPVDHNVRDRDFASNGSPRGRKPVGLSYTNQPRYQAPLPTTQQQQQHHQQAQHHQQQSTPQSQILPATAEHQSLPSPGFHNRLTSDFNPVRASASPRTSILSARPTDNPHPRYSIMSMQQSANEPPPRPAKWFERETNASFQLKLSPRGITSTKPLSASSGKVHPDAQQNMHRDHDDWEFPVLSDDPLALSRLLISALFTMQDVPRAGQGSKQHALQLVPAGARTSGARHFAMRQVKGDPLAGGRTGEEEEERKREKEKEGKEGGGAVGVKRDLGGGKGGEAKKVMWRIRFRRVA